MPKYRVLWKKEEKGISYVDAENEEEALNKAERGEDENFENLNETYGCPEWKIDEIENEED